MIQGLKVAFTGEEIIQALNDRIGACNDSIQFKRDEIDGKVELKGEIRWQEPVENVEAEIRALEHRVRTFALFRDRLFPARTYLLGRADLKFTGLMQPAPDWERDFEPGETTRWVTRCAD
jgi:hypothetical protein